VVFSEKYFYMLETSLHHPHPTPAQEAAIITLARPAALSQCRTC